MRGIAFVRTNFGYRQNDRYISILYMSGWWPRLRRKRLPVFPPLAAGEVLSTARRFGLFNGLNETGEPKFTREFSY